MPDKELVRYIKDHRKKYGLKKLKESLVNQGVGEDEVDEAIAAIEGSGEHLPRMDAEKREKIERGDVGGGKGGGKFFDPIFKGLGVGRNKRGFYRDVVVYGAISFMILAVIVTVSENLVGRFVYSQVAESLGIFGKLALPDVFSVSINLWSSLVSLFWMAIFGGVATFIFIRYSLRIWPFVLWKSLFKKLFALYLIIEVLFGIVLNGILIAIAPVYLLGYLFVAVGMILGSYVASFYFVANMGEKHEEVIKELLRKR